MSVPVYVFDGMTPELIAAYGLRKLHARVWPYFPSNFEYIGHLIWERFDLSQQVALEIVRRVNEEESPELKQELDGYLMNYEKLLKAETPEAKLLRLALQNGAELESDLQIDGKKGIGMKREEILEGVVNFLIYKHKLSYQQAITLAEEAYFLSDNHGINP